MARPPAIETDTAFWLAVDISSLKLTDDQLVRLFSDNAEYQFELSAKGELIIMPPAHNKTEMRNTKFIQRLANWAEQDGSGVAFGNNTLFTLPNGAKRGPDAAWVSNTRWNRLTEDEKESFSNLAPEFVVELRSKSDRLRRLKEKMDEYMANGVRLAWLLDPIANCATIYRADEPPVEIEHPAILNGDPVLPGFHFDFRELLM
jgi:Uma2 family endonuclease